MGNQKDLSCLSKELSNTNCNVAIVINKFLEDGKNSFIASGVKIRDQSRKWNESDKIIKWWKDQYQFDIVNFIINYEQDYDHKVFNQVSNPILILNAYVSIRLCFYNRLLYLIDYLEVRTNPT